MSVSTEASLAKLFRLLDGSVGVLMQHNGRDKAMSAVYYSLLFCAGRINCANTTNKLMTLAKQFSSARIVLRRFNDLPLIGANFIHFIHPPSDENASKYLFSNRADYIYSLALQGIFEKSVEFLQLRPDADFNVHALNNLIPIYL
uniref:Uncharacterized protein n=1 Tax=Plectus sambesii TaxID=2011161 RepID=A0A914USZ4_9BILA